MSGAVSGAQERTHYDLLGVPAGADRDTVKAAWRAAVDRVDADPDAGPAMLREVNEAAEVLLDPSRREAYDARLHAERAERAGRAERAERAERAAREQEEGATDSDGLPTAQPATSTGRPGRVALAGLVALALVVLVAAAAAVHLHRRATTAQAFEDALTEAAAHAEAAAEVVLSYDHQRLEADRDAAVRYLTGTAEEEYLENWPQLQERAAEQEATVEASVHAAATMVRAADRAEPDRMPVLLFVDQTTTSAGSDGEPRTTQNRVRFEMVREAGTWLVAEIASIATPR